MRYTFEECRNEVEDYKRKLNCYGLSDDNDISLQEFSE